MSQQQVSKGGALWLLYSTKVLIGDYRRVLGGLDNR